MNSTTKILLVFSSQNPVSDTLGRRCVQHLKQSFEQIDPEFNIDLAVADVYEQSLDVEQSFDFVLTLLDRNIVEQERQLTQLKGFITEYASATCFKFLIENINQANLPLPLLQAFDVLLYDSETNKLDDGPKYWETLVDFVHEVMYQVQDQTGKKTVYLAETTEKYASVRKNIKRELLKRNYRVLPTVSFNYLGVDTAVLEKDLEHSDIAIHLLGTGGDSDENLADQINLKTSEYCITNPLLKRFVWLEEQTQDLLEEEDLYIEQVKRDKAALRNSEILQVPIEKLKAIILKEFAKEGSEVLGSTTIPAKSLYLIYEQEDALNVQLLEQTLSQAGVSIYSLDYKLPQLEIFKQHRELLTEVSSVFVYHSRKNTKWVNMKLMEVVKAPGYGRKSPFSFKGIYLKDNMVVENISRNFDFLEHFSIGESLQETLVEEQVITALSND
ncbi:hypothetical protein OAH12_01725 [Cyclobacteriaceae bacterium]|nr:hypothetical protein [Cyclobacteriaceae bacterium]